MRPCFAFSAVGARGMPAHLSIFEEIGFYGIQAKTFRTQLDAVAASGQKTVQVEISSPGGSVADALAMYNSLRACGLAVTTKVMGAAMSAASLVFMAGDRRVMPKNSWLMLHSPSTIAAGNADDLREAADMLRKLGGLVRGTYCARSGMGDKQMTEILSQDTYLSAEEARELGFATELAAAATATARFNLAKAEMPAHVQAAYGVAAPVVQSSSDLWKAFRTARKPEIVPGPAAQNGAALWAAFRAARVS